MAILLQERDLHLFAELQACRFLTLRQISKLCFDGHTEAAKKRLQKLQGSGFVRRQFLGVTAQSIYVLGKMGRIFCNKERSGRLAPPLRLPPIATLRHEILLRDIRAILLQSASEVGFEVQEFSVNSSELSFDLGTGVTRPDGYFVVGARDRAFRFFLEVDNGTEGQGVLLKRVEAYRSFWKSGSFAERLGVPAEKYRSCQFRVLFVFSSRSRMENFLLNLFSLGIRNFVRTVTERELAGNLVPTLDLPPETSAPAQSSALCEKPQASLTLHRPKAIFPPQQDYEGSGGIWRDRCPPTIETRSKKSNG